MGIHAILGYLALGFPLAGSIPWLVILCVFSHL